MLHGVDDGRVSLAIVSHSATLATGLAELVSRSAADVRVTAVGGGSDGSLGVDVGRVTEVLRSLAEHGPVVVLADLGSSVLAARIAIESLEGAASGRVRIADAPLVEGAVAAAACASSGAALADVVGAAEDARSVDKL